MEDLNQLIEQITALNLTGKHRRVINMLSPTIFKTYNNARLYYEAGLANELKTDYSRAIQRYTEAINIDARYEAAIYSRGKLYLRKKEFNLAALDFERLISLNSREYKYHLSRGEVYQSTNDHGNAIACFTKAIELQPGSEEALLLRAYTWLDSDEPRKSVEDATTALSLNPDSMMAYSIRGRAFSKLSQYEVATEDLTRAIKLDPLYLRNYEYSADMWKSANNYAKAIENYSKALRFNAEDPGVYLKRAEIYFEMAQYEKALTDFDAADRFGSDRKAEEGIDKTTTALAKENSEKRFANKQLIRKKAISFLDKIRTEYGSRFQKAKDGFRCGKPVQWDFELNRPKTADLAGWLPEIMPEIAKWDVVRSIHNDAVVVDTLTPLGELFFPHLVGIPIKEELWEAVAGPLWQHKVGERTIGYVQKFGEIEKMIERLILAIRREELDDHLIMEHYSPEISNDAVHRAYRNELALRLKPRFFDK